MSFFLKQRLKKINKKHTPRAEFLMSLEKNLQSRGYLPVARTSLASRWLIAPRVAFASLMTIIISFGMAGTAAYAYASDAVLPDHPLYPIREAVESVEYAFAPVSQKPLIGIKQARRRLEEIKLVQADHVGEEEKRAEKIEQKLEQVAERIERKVAREEDQDSKKEERKQSRARVKAEAEDLKELVRQRKEARKNGVTKHSIQELEDQVTLLEEGIEEGE